MARKVCARRVKARATAGSLSFILQIRSNGKSWKGVIDFAMAVPALCPSSPILFNPLNFKRVALLADIDALRLADAIGAAGGFMNVAAKKIGRLFASHPFAQRRTAGVFAR